MKKHLDLLKQLYKWHYNQLYHKHNISKSKDSWDNMYYEYQQMLYNSQIRDRLKYDDL